MTTYVCFHILLLRSDLNGIPAALKTMNANQLTLDAGGFVYYPYSEKNARRIYISVVFEIQNPVACKTPYTDYFCIW